MKVIINDLTYEENFWNARTFLTYKNDLCEKQENSTYIYKKGTEEEKIIKLEGKYLFGINATIDNETFVLVKKPSVLEYILSLLFVGFIFYAIPIGAIIGGLFGVLNFVLNRQYKSLLVKLISSIIIALICFGVIYLIISILNNFPPQN